ncbi:MAG: DUF2155 domain-containing protein [Alphaproteobacteria bacterium]|jgi:hypothetical protein|nr:DUF2155 domain-containing protein [Alphaproteobacteria bacterium]
MKSQFALITAAALVAAASFAGLAAAQPDPSEPPVESTPLPPVETPDPPSVPTEPGPPVETVPVPPTEFPSEDVTPPPPEVIVPAPPSGEAPVAIGVILGGLDKVAARTAKFEVNLKQKVFYNTLIVTALACKTRPPEEPPESAAFLEIQERKSDGTVQKIFSGWMFASSPALNALEHPVYDVWVVNCKTVPAKTAAPAPPNT